MCYPSLALWDVFHIYFLAIVLCLSSYGTWIDEYDDDEYDIDI